MSRRRIPASSTLIAVLLACRMDGARAAGSDWTSEAEAAVATAQTERGLAYLETPLAEASWSLANGDGWSLGATAAKTFHGAQAALTASVAYGWPLAAGVDAYVALGHNTYHDRGGWRYRYESARATVNAGDRLFASVTQLFHGRIHANDGSMAVPPALAKELVWRQPLATGPTLVAGVGHAAQRHRPQASYWYGNLGLAVPVGDATLEASWIATDAAARRYWGAQAGNRWVASLRRGW